MTPKTHLLVLSSWYPTKKAPFLGNFIRRHAQLLATNYEVTVLNTVASETSPAIKQDIQREGNFTEITVYYTQTRFFPVKIYRQYKALRNGLTGIEHPKLIISHILFPKVWQFAYVQRKLSIPWMHVENGSFFRKEKRDNWSFAQKLMARYTARNCTELIAVSPVLKKDMETIFGRKEITVIGNYVDTTLFYPKEKIPHETTRFLHISTLDEQVKNPKGIIDACKILHEKIGNTFSLTILSDESTTQLEAYCQAVGISHCIQFEHAKQWNELPAFYHTSDAFILNSTYETFSIVLAEAWCTGTPTITTSVGIGYQLPSELGLQVTKNDPQDLAEKMAQFITQKSRFSANEIHQFGEKFSSENILNQLHTRIQCLLTTKK